MTVTSISNFCDLSIIRDIQSIVGIFGVVNLLLRLIDFSFLILSKRFDDFRKRLLIAILELLS